MPTIQVANATTSGGLRGDTQINTDNLLTSAEKAGISGMPGYPPSGDDPIPTVDYVEEQVVDKSTWQNFVDFVINYVHDEAPDGSAFSGVCDITNAGGGNLNCFVAAGHGLGSGTYSITVVGAMTGTVTGIVTVVDPNNFTIPGVYVADEVGQPWSYDFPPTNGEKCLNLNTIAPGLPLLHTFVGGSWNAGVAITSGERFVWRFSGSDQSGDSGDRVADDTIRQYESGSGLTLIFRTISPTDHYSYFLDEDGHHYFFGSGAHSLLLRPQDGPSLVEFAYLGGIPANLVDVEVYMLNGVKARKLQPWGGSIIGLTLESDDVRAAGTLTVDPTVNGVIDPSGLLQLVFDGATTNDDSATADPGGINFSAGDQLGIKINTDAGWMPNTSSVFVTMYVVYGTNNMLP